VSARRIRSPSPSVTWRAALLVTLAFTAVRFVAMGFNRIADRGIDARNPRTQARELPSGRLTGGQAWASVIAAMVVFLAWWVILEDKKLKAQKAHLLQVGMSATMKELFVECGATARLA